VIVPMKEVVLVAPRGDRDVTLERLQDAGVLHVAEDALADDAQADELRERIEHARHAIGVLEHLPPTGNEDDTGIPDAEVPGATAPDATVPDAGGAGRRTGDRRAVQLVEEVERLASELHDLRATEAELAHERERLAPFGAFDPSDLHALRAEGVAVRLAHPTARTPLPEVPEAAWIDLGPSRRRRALALVGPIEAVDAADVPDEVAWPEQAPERLQERIRRVHATLARTRARLAALAKDREVLERWLRTSRDALRVEEVRAGMPTVGAVVLLRGFVPEDAVERVRSLAAEQGWGLWIRDVEDPAEAPTLIRNPRWLRPIEPLFGFLGVVPAYGHVDISLPFLVFFSLFFAMIVGDAGYGAIFLALTELARRRMHDPPRRVLSLMRLLSVVTIAWGLLTGNVFGVDALPSALAWARLDWLTVESNVIGLTFAIGAVHLTLAHAWNALRWANSVRALAEIGWVAVTWTMYLLARHLVLGDAVPAAAWPVFGVGLTLIVLFTTPWRYLRRDWFHHAMLPLTLVNDFVDVVSYVRLFAVGAATYAVASAFNTLAADLGLAGPVGGVATALVLFFGHALNVLLAAMGVLVHGVRLNTLEFAGHLHLSWTGRPYRPLAHEGGRAAEGDA
jgi:V/A-type H+-transporting ATPase subunit I